MVLKKTYFSIVIMCYNYFYCLRNEKQKIPTRINFINYFTEIEIRLVLINEQENGHWMISINSKLKRLQIYLFSFYRIY